MPGVDDNGEIVGVENSEKVLLQIVNMLRDSIKPDVTMFTTCIRQMIKETDGDKYEEIRSFNQELTFEVVHNEFKKRRLELGEAQMKTLGFINKDNIFTNLGLLLSDQCTHTLKVAVFNGVSKSELKDRREFGGSLLKQMITAYEFIDLLTENLRMKFLHRLFAKFIQITSYSYNGSAIRIRILPFSSSPFNNILIFNYSP